MHTGMTLYQLALTFAPVPLGLAFAVLIGICALRPARCMRSRSARRWYRERYGE
jgi:hypothetical protein